MDSMESMIEELFGNENLNSPDSYSEEVYFGLKHPFSMEMINYASLLQKEIKKIVGPYWKDQNKSGELVKKEIDKTQNEKDAKSIASILDNMGSCIARHCNIEKCYIGLYNDYNAVTMPLVWDSSFLLKSTSKGVTYKKGPYTFLKNKAIRSSKDLQDHLYKIEDIVLNKNGYKFKNKEGKVFIINIGLPLIIQDDYEASPEEICSTIFHEIGHNFQQLLHGANQMIVDFYLTYHLQSFIGSYVLNIFTFIEYVFAHTFLRDAIKATSNSSKERFQIIKMILMNGIYIKNDGTISTRKDIGEEERKNLEAVIEYAKKTNSLVKLSRLIRVLGVIGTSIVKVFMLLISPLKILNTIIVQNNLNKRYSDIIKHNKSYEQFADTFATSYGFGKDTSRFYLRIQQMVEKNKKNGITHLSILNNVPVLSKIQLLNELMVQKLNTNLLGYDEDYVRISQVYRALDHELTSNKNLSSTQKKEIIEHMEVVKESFTKFKELEMKKYGNNPNLIKFLLKKARSGTITEVADGSNIVEGVLEVIDEYEKNNIVKQPPIVTEFENELKKGKSNIEKLKETLNEATSNVINAVTKIFN